MYKRKYFNLRKAFTEYNKEEEEKEKYNIGKAEKALKKILKVEEPPLKKLNKKKEKENKLKPINTRVLIGEGSI